MARRDNSVPAMRNANPCSTRMRLAWTAISSALLRTQGTQNGTRLHQRNHLDNSTNIDSGQHLGKSAAATMSPVSVVGPARLVLLVRYHLDSGRRLGYRLYSCSYHNCGLHLRSVRGRMGTSGFRHCDRCGLSKLHRRSLGQSLVPDTGKHNVCKFEAVRDETRILRLHIHLSLLDWNQQRRHGYSAE